MVSIPILQIGKQSQRDLSNIHRATQLLVSDGLGYDLLPYPYPIPPPWSILLTRSLLFGCLFVWLFWHTTSSWSLSLFCLISCPLLLTLFLDIGNGDLAVRQPAQISLLREGLDVFEAVGPGRGEGSFYVIGPELFCFMTCVFISPDSYGNPPL